MFQTTNQNYMCAISHSYVGFTGKLVSWNFTFHGRSFFLVQIKMAIGYL